MPSYVVLYDNTNGNVLKIWERTASDNVSTWVADGKLTVDGVDVVLGLSGLTSEFAAEVIASVDTYDAAAPPGVYEVDDFLAPGSVVERTDPTRDPYYPYTAP